MPRIAGAHNMPVGSAQSSFGHGLDHPNLSAINPGSVAPIPAAPPSPSGFLGSHGLTIVLAVVAIMIIILVIYLYMKKTAEKEAVAPQAGTGKTPPPDGGTQQAPPNQEAGPASGDNASKRPNAEQLRQLRELRKRGKTPQPPNYPTAAPQPPPTTTPQPPPTTTPQPPNYPTATPQPPPTTTPQPPNYPITTTPQPPPPIVPQPPPTTTSQPSPGAPPPAPTNGLQFTIPVGMRGVEPAAAAPLATGELQTQLPSDVSLGFDMTSSFIGGEILVDPVPPASGVVQDFTVPMVQPETAPQVLDRTSNVTKVIDSLPGL